jgi:hypothetical protein
MASFSQARKLLDLHRFPASSPENAKDAPEGTPFETGTNVATTFALKI